MELERRLPQEYEGWQRHESELRRMTTPELVQEIQDGPPDRRLAALSVIDLADVEPGTIDDWLRTLPAAEANELAGAIPAQRAGSSCADDLRWVEVARSGYERRRLPTFLVMLFSSLEAMETRHCEEAPAAWERIGDWLSGFYDKVAKSRDEETLEDVSLFVFENYLDRAPIFGAFCGLLSRNQALARRLSTNPSFLLAGIDPAAQRRALCEAEAGGGLPFTESWRLLTDD